MPRCYLLKKNATKYLEESGERKTTAPKSPTEATTAPTSPNYYRTLDGSITMANGYLNDYIPYSQDTSVIRRAPVVASHDGGIPIFRERSAEETEAAHDLLELSRSLPPLPNPVVVRVTPRYDEYSEKKYPKLYEESPEDSQVAYYEVSDNYRNGFSEGPKPHIPVSVVVRVPSCVQSKTNRGLDKSISPLMTYEEPTYEDEVPSVICDNQNPEIARRLSEESFEEFQSKNYSREYYSEKTLPSLLPLVSHHYRDEAAPSVICDTQCLGQHPEMEESIPNEPIPYEEAPIISYEQSLSSAPVEVTYEEDPNMMVIAMTPTRPEVTHVISRPVPTKVIAMPQDPSVPTHIIQFSHIVPNTSYGMEERLQTTIEPVYPVPSGSLLPPPTFSEPETGTNFVSHTPVIRYQPSSEPANLEPANLEPANLEPANLEPADLEPANLEPPHLEPPNLEPPNLEPPNLGPPNLGPPNLEPPNLELANLEPENPDSENPEPENSESANAETTEKPETNVTKPVASENHSDAENNNPNSKDKPGTGKKKRSRASFLPTDWKRKKTNPSEDSENSGKRKYSCTQCGKKYATSSNLSRHKQTHRSLDSQSAKKCMTCGKAYVSMPALAMHLLTHKLSHACGICGKMFSRPWLLQGHLRSHTGEKPYRCGHCGKAFADRSNLRAHMQTHSFEKNYICLKCKKSFALKSYLSKHLESSCLKENNDIEMKAGIESPTNSMDTIDVETWSKDGDVDDPDPVEVETDESMDEIVVV